MPNDVVVASRFEQPGPIGPREDSVETRQDRSGPDRFFLVSNAPSMIPVEEVTRLGPEATDRVTVGFLRDSRLRVYSPFQASVRRDSNGVMVQVSDDINVYGRGQSLSEAIIDFQHAVAELYFTLKADEGHLGRGVEVTWNALQVHIGERPQMPAQHEASRVR